MGKMGIYLRNLVRRGVEGLAAAGRGADCWVPFTPRGRVAGHVELHHDAHRATAGVLDDRARVVERVPLVMRSLEEFGGVWRALEGFVWGMGQNGSAKKNKRKTFFSLSLNVAPPLLPYVHNFIPKRPRGIWRHKSVPQWECGIWQNNGWQHGECDEWPRKGCMRRF